MKTQKEITEKILGLCGRMVAYSKGRYRYNNPQNLVIFNSNLCTTKEKIWYGDIDITKQESDLIELAKKLKTDLFVLYESDARFENEENPKLEKNVIKITSDGKTIISERLKDSVIREDNRLVYIKNEEKPQELPDYADEEYQEKDFIKVIPLPDLKEFKSKKNEDDPLSKFWVYISEQLEMDLKTLHVCDFVVGRNVEDELKKYFTQWVKKTHKHFDDYDIQKSVNWTIMDIGPMVFLGSKYGPTWVKKNCVYFKGKKK